MKEEQYDTSLLVLYSLVFLFIAFLLFGTSKTTGLVTLPLLGESSELPLTTTLGIALTVLVLAGAIFLISRKIRSKKQVEIPKAEDLLDLTAQLNTAEPVKELPQLPKEPVKPERMDTLTEADLDRLFTEARQSETPPAPPAPLPQAQQLLARKEPEKELVLEKQINYKELKSLILNLLNKNYTHDSILKYLKNKGYSLLQIRKAVDMINQENLANYIKQCYVLGIERETIIKNLLSHGWSNEDIRKQL